QWGAVRAGEGLLISTHPQAQAEGNHLDASEANSQIESSLSNAQALSEVAKNQQTDPLEVLDNLKNFLEQIEQQDENKAAAFKQALMILSAPNSIALSSQQDVHLSADGQISQSAGESINLSTQQSLIAHASQKLSLFAAQEGARLYAGKGKVEIQAQGDGADLIARKGVQIISTEANVDITSAKEIVLTAGGSQLRINASGIFPTTASKFEVKAGQHLFLQPQNVVEPKKSLPQMATLFSNQINYQWNSSSAGEKEIFVIDQTDGKLLKTNKSILNEQHQLSTFRFYTLQSTDFIALSFNSLCTHLSGAVSDEQIDYLLEEIEEDQEDEVSTHEDIES
uniref:DUF2345 domain-containing protein n=1 Tax=Acinetobacter indicus TaxID=756892 RepID=UPI00144462FD